MSADPEEEDVLLSEFDHVRSAPPQRPALDDMVKRDVEADLQEIRRPLLPAAVSLEAIEEALTQSQILKSQGIVFTQSEPGVWDLSYKQQQYSVTFQSEVFGERPSHRLLVWGDPLFESLLSERGC
jgi:hypothetical protein